jgi:hypothetical protein
VTLPQVRSLPIRRLLGKGFRRADKARTRYVSPAVVCSAPSRLSRGSGHAASGHAPSPARVRRGSGADVSAHPRSRGLKRAAFGASRYVGLILTAGESDIRWQRPKIHGWVVRRDRNGRAICEPASVESG